MLLILMDPTTLDAACASTMATIQSAVQGLRNNDFDMAVTGGVDRSMGVPTYVKFSKDRSTFTDTFSTI